LSGGGYSLIALYAPIKRMAKVTAITTIISIISCAPGKDYQLKVRKRRNPSNVFAARWLISSMLYAGIALYILGLQAHPYRKNSSVLTSFQDANISMLCVCMAL